MREIRTSGLTRGMGITPSLLYCSFLFSPLGDFLKHIIFLAGTAEVCDTAFAIKIVDIYNCLIIDNFYGYT